MRLIKALFALLFIAFGVLFGALNRQAVRIELGFTGIDGTVGRRVDQRPRQVRQLRIGQRQHFRRAAPCRRYRPGFHLQRKRQRLRLGLIDHQATAAINPTTTFSEHYPVACTSRHTPTPRKNPE